MTRLDWKSDQDLKPARSDLAHEKAELSFQIGPAHLQQWAQEFEKVVSGAENELRLDLPENWTVYWKLREGESRLLLAHPETDAWVGTVALTPEHAQAWLERLRKLDAGNASARVSDLGAVSRLGNFDLQIQLRNGS